MFLKVFGTSNGSKSVNREFIRSCYFIGKNLTLDFGYNYQLMGTIVGYGKLNMFITMIMINSVIMSK